MKTVTVNVPMQMDIPESGDALTHVLNVLDAVNTTLYGSGIEAQPQVFTSGISNSDLLVNNDEEEEEENDEE